MHDRLDLDPLDPTGDARRWEGLVQRILADAEPLLERRAAPGGPLLALADFLRPALGVAVACTLASAVVLLRDPDGAPGLLSALPEEFGLPRPVAEWLSDERQPTADDLLASLEWETP